MAGPSNGAHGQLTTGTLGREEAAPSADLRRWFAHDPVKWADFQRHYFSELDRKPEAWRPIVEAAQRGNVTLLYSARDTAHNNAVALKVYVEKALEATPDASHDDR